MAQLIAPPACFNNSWWITLTQMHQQFSLGGDLARRYLSDISPFAAIREVSSEAFEALEVISEPDDVLVLMHDRPLELPKHWITLVRDELITMVLEKSLPALDSEFEIQRLGQDDVTDILALTELTHPGPFRKDTIQLGRYFGIRIDGKLVAMAGERGRLPGYTEVSAVCTHPDFQGRGFAKALVLHVCQGILKQGDTPMLRLLSTNERAFRVYKNLGFEQVGEITHAVRFQTRKLGS
jgi:predicted GNAT family acetyltransferase